MTKLELDMNDFPWEDLDLNGFQLDNLDDLFDVEYYALADTTSVDVKQKRQRKRKYSEETRQMMKEAYERYKLLRPRILRTDFRRQFANMCTNVFNSGDHRVVINYINTYCAHDVSVRHTDFRSHNKIGVAGVNLNMTGLSALAKYWYTAMTNCPDVVCYMHNAIVKVRSDGTASIKCDFELRGHAVLPVHTAVRDPNNSSSTLPRSSTCISDDFMADAPKIQELLARYTHAKRMVQDAYGVKRRRTPQHHVFPHLQISSQTNEQAVDSQQLTLQPLDQRVLNPTQLSAAVRYLLSSSDAPLAGGNACTDMSDQPIDRDFDVQMDLDGRFVITAATDVLCSYEIEFNAENRVASVSVFCKK